MGLMIGGTDIVLESGKPPAPPGQRSLIERSVEQDDPTLEPFMKVGKRLLAAPCSSALWPNAVAESEPFDLILRPRPLPGFDNYRKPEEPQPFGYSAGPGVVDWMRLTFLAPPFELFVYRDLESWRAWQQHGATPETHGTMVHVLVGVTSVTFVVDADSEVGRVVMAELKKGTP